MESSNSKDIGSHFIEVKQLLQNHDELCYTMEDLSLQVQISYVLFYNKYVHTSVVLVRACNFSFSFSNLAQYF